MLLAPPRFEFGWGEIAQRRMDPLVHIHIVQEAPNLVISVMIVEILGKVNLLLPVKGRVDPPGAFRWYARTFSRR